MTTGDIETAKATLLDSTAALDARIRALYVIKQLRDATAVAILLEAIDTTDSVLLQHEILYNLGQFGAGEACMNRLMEVATTPEKYNEVSRHEAIEAIGAIGQEAAVPFLEDLAAKTADCPPVQESCVLAVDRIRLEAKLGKEGYQKLVSPEFGSVDPAPACEERSVAALKAVLMDPSKHLFERYRAMFALRDLRTPESIAALSDSLRADQSSCLFRHEVAFVLGQLEEPASIPALVESLKDGAEHGMVRHEAAEALGAMADAKTWDLLAEFAKDPEPIVADSCIVALEMHKYWSQWKAPAEQDASA
eukprot:CAMPEP_0174839184 /NCGR_PEP_ID=MMETSP1114-20130205/7876_1 /TAXON_ID=312471 /ORGANISM="Neobodo designis, Strain CCAP 1951/1" /LENGTH=306 /DNA_ID=CAMNT_0016073305 /DNA_START=47 /DNA_END=967 /DNA_ORIENTATION=+